MSVLLTGLALGAAYGLVGVSVAAVAQAARTLHLAVGSILVAGTLTQLFLAAVGVPGWLAVVAALSLGAVLSAALTPLVGRRSGDRLLLPLLGSAAAGVAYDAATAATVGTRQFRPEPLFDADPLVVAFAVGLPAASALALAVRRSAWGRRLRLVGGSPEAAALAGISPRRTVAWVFAASGIAAVVAGLLVAPITGVGAGQGPLFTIRGVAAAVLLGIGGPERAVVAGLVLGLAEAAGQRAWPAAGGGSATAAVIIAVLAVRGGERRRAWGRVW